MPPRFRRAFVPLLALFLAFLTPARAATLTWQAPPDTPANWLDPANWSTNTLPTSADTVQVNNGGQPQLSSGTAAASSLQLAANPGDVASLSLTGGQLTATNAYVGYAGTASLLHTGGTLTGTTLYLAYGSNTAGSYTLHGPAALSFTKEYIGASVSATFTQTGGLNSAGTLYLAGNGSSGSPFGSATYDLSGGQLNSGTAFVGFSGSATFTQSGGTHWITGGFSGATLYLGYNTGSSGTYNLLGNASLSTGGTLYVGSASSNAPGLFNLSGNASLIAGIEYVGAYGPGTFVHTSGTNTTSYLYVGKYSAPGSYTLGDAALLSAQRMEVSNGSFKQTGGSVLLNNPNYPYDTLYIANGSYALSGAAASLSSTGPIHLAYGTSASTGTFIQSGGSVSTNGQQLYLADGATASLATYTLSSGSLSTGAQYIGYTGTGTFDQSGGVNRAGALYLGYTSNATSPSNGSYSLSNNAQLFSLTQYHACGTSSRSTFTQSGGTTDLGTNPLYLAYGTNSVSTYSLAAGSLLSGDQLVGRNGSATFTQSGGVNNLGAATLILGNNSGARGVYLLTAADATLITSAEDIGPGGSPSLFRQTAGSNTTGTLTVRANSRYELSGGSLQITSSLTNSGTLDLLAGSLSTPSLINNGTLTLAAPATLRAPASPALSSVTGNGSTTVAAGATLRAAYLQQSSLTVAGTVQLSSTLTTSTLSSLTLSQGSRLDLTTNTLRISTATPGSTSASQVRQYLHDGLLLSSTAGSDPLNLLTLGYLFDPAAKTITIKTTPLGDANLDGTITPDDYALLDQGLAQHLSFWSNGDFNYDATIDQQDYLLIDTTYGQAQGFSPGFLSQRESQFGPTYASTLLASIPEPSSLAACGLALLPLLRRRTKS